MAIYETYSRRKRREAQGGTPEVYEYESVPLPLRGQIVHIWRDALGVPPKADPVMGLSRPTISNNLWSGIHETICREKGTFRLHGEWETDFENCCNYLMKAQSVDDVLDIVELSFVVITLAVEKANWHEKKAAGIKIDAVAAVQELNARFIEHAIGYQFENGQIIRIDRQYVHAEVVKAALILLHEPEFEAANADFMKAHEHYRAKNYKDAVVAAQRSFESTIKCICKGMEITLKPGDRASDLIKAVRNAGLFPDYLGAGLDTYVAALKTGLPEVRNNAGGHGAAPGSPPIPDYIAAYAIHLTATNIVLCVEAYKANSRRGDLEP